MNSKLTGKGAAKSVVKKALQFSALTLSYEHRLDKKKVVQHVPRINLSHLNF